MLEQIKKFGAILLVASIGGVGSAYMFNKYDNDKQVYTIAAEKIPVHLASGASVPMNIDFTEAAERTVHGVVHIKKYFTTTQVGNPFDMFFGGQREYRIPQQATGSGVIISNDGYIVTNNHVVDNADKVEVTLSNNKRYEGKVIGTDPSTDLALVKIDAGNLPYISFGNSDDVKVGQWVLAVGNPFNLTSTVTAGIISAKGRNINILTSNNAQGQAAPIESFIQTDAAVNPGNSGGALVNTSGDLIGINSAIASNTGSYTGYSFAVPVNIVRKVVDDFMEYGTVQRAYIGIQGRPMDADLAREKNLNSSQGVYVDKVTPEGAAKDAGIMDGDVITKIEGMPVNDWPDLLEHIGRHRPGDKVTIAYSRDNKEYESVVTLKNKSGNTSVVKNETIKVLGAEISPLTSEDKAKLGIDSGAKITRLGNGVLKNAGVRENFIITSIDKQPVTNTSDVESILNSKGNGGVLIEGVYPNGMRAWYGIGVNDER